MSREVFIVAGMASKASNLAPLRLLAARHERTDSVHYIDSATPVDGRFVATTSTQQAAEIEAVLEQSGRSALIYAQSMGTLAAMKCLQRRPDKVRAVAIAPPLPSPNDILRHRRITTRMNVSNGAKTLPSYSFALGDLGPSSTPPEPVDVHLDEAYLDDIDRESQDFADRLRGLADTGALKIVLPNKDWNVAAIEFADELPGATIVDGSHSLHADPKTMAATADFLHRLAAPVPALA